jgi:hypothetical protein
VTTGDAASFPASLPPTAAAGNHRRRRRILPLEGSRPLHDVPRAAEGAAAPYHRVRRRRRRLWIRTRDPFERVLGGGGCLGGSGGLFGGTAAAN